MTTRHFAVVAFSLLVVISGAALAQVPTCPGSGLTVTGGRFGDDWSFELSGPPGASALLASDVAPGPVLTPFGAVCLGLSSSLVVTPLTLDATGSFSASGTLPINPPFAAGSHLSVQGALAHPSLPGGFALTNGEVLTLRPPRIGIFRWSQYGSAIDLIDGTTDTVAVTIPTTTWAGSRVVRIPRLGWYAWPTASGAFTCIDDFTGATVLTIPNVITMQGGSWDVSDDGKYLFVTSLGPSPVYNRVNVKVYSLPSGALLSQQSISSIAYVNSGIYPVPGTSVAYIASDDRFHVYDALTNTEIATIQLPGSLQGGGQPYRYAFLAQGFLYALVGTSLVTIDTATHTISSTGPPIPGLGAAPLALGPGAAGLSLWATNYQQGSGLVLCDIPVATGVPQEVLPVTFPGMLPPAKAVFTAGGTEILVQLLSFAPMSPPVVVAVNVQTHAVTSLGALGVVDVLRSDTLTKAYAYSVTLGGMVSVVTDPVGGGGSIVNLSPGVPQLVAAQVVSN
jgi:hypothetical protein